MNIEIIHQDNENITLRVGKTEAHVALFCDEINVTCRNRSHRVQHGPGRFFSTWDSAIDGYKSDTMKLAIATARDLLTGSAEGEQPDADMTPDEARDVLAGHQPGDTATALWVLGRSAAAEKAGRPRLPITVEAPAAPKSEALDGRLYGPDGLDESLWKMDEPYKPAPASLVGRCEKCGAKTGDLAFEYGLYCCPTCRRHPTPKDRGPSALEAFKARLREIDEDGWERAASADAAVIHSTPEHEDDDCPFCDGRGTIECGDCGGEGGWPACDTGVYNVPIGHVVDCKGCNGRGEFECPSCDGEGIRGPAAHSEEIQKSGAVPPASDASKPDRVDVRPVQGEQAGRPGLDEPEGVEAGPLSLEDEETAWHEYDVVDYYDGLGRYQVGVVTDVCDTGLELIRSDRRGPFWISKETRFLRRIHQSDTAAGWESRHEAAWAAVRQLVAEGRPELTPSTQLAPEDGIYWDGKNQRLSLNSK